MISADSLSTTIYVRTQLESGDTIILRGICDDALSIELKKLPIFQLIKPFVQKHCRVLVLRFLVKNVHHTAKMTHHACIFWVKHL